MCERPIFRAVLVTFPTHVIKPTKHKKKKNITRLLRNDEFVSRIDRIGKILRNFDGAIISKSKLIKFFLVYAYNGNYA